MFQSVLLRSMAAATLLFLAACDASPQRVGANYQPPFDQGRQSRVPDGVAGGSTARYSDENSLSDLVVRAPRTSSAR